MESDEAPPPPYSAVDPLLAQANSRNAAATAEVNRVLLRLRGGETTLGTSPASPASSSSSHDFPASSASLPTHFTSAAEYFVERPPPTSSRQGDIVEHCVTIFPRSQSKDIRRRPRCWTAQKTEDITQQDWDVFLRYLFPPHLGLASTSAQLPRQVRAEIQRDRKDRPQETDEERKRRIAAVIMEWNQYFFEPRSARVVYVYVMDPQSAPRSSLCPKCWPAATTRENRVAQASDAGRGRSQRSPVTPTAAEQPGAPPVSAVYTPGPYAYPQYPTPHTPYAPYGHPAPYSPAVYPPHPAYHYPPPPPPPPPPGHYPPQPPWGWTAPPYGVPYQDPSMSKGGGPLDWIASLASQAQKYGERFTEQAQHYGRQVEEQALAHSRWIEEQAGLQGRKVEDAFTGFVSPSRDDWIANQPPKPGYVQNSTAHTPTTTPTATATTTTTTVTPQRTAPAQPERTRRASIDSEASDLSFSSIDSLSTTSELSASDLATVRAQLLSLNDHHDRELYEAAVGLRRQLDVLQQSRRQNRTSGRSGWRHGWRRWDSPSEQHQKQSDKRAVKEETRATRKAFRDVLRRAREEQREKRRLKRTRRRQEQRAREVQRDGAEMPLEQHMQRLELDTNRESRSTVQSFTSIPSPARSLAESDSEISSISTPSTSSNEKMPVKGKSEKSAIERKPCKEAEKSYEKDKKGSDQKNRGASRRN
ncbi:hypothetical protein AtubIFM57258_006820 [Aspergillus tubingensis]|nr:hypothetical protein AtubIFM57258_006820 [Aspergillus tubingensis]